MTKQKHLKERVRARMVKTGERYAAARANVVDHDIRRPGQPSPDSPGQRGHVQTAETSALARALEDLGVRDPRTGLPLSEALLFGIAGGIGGGYWVFEYKAFPYPLLSLFTRHAWDSSKRFLDGACARLGLTATYHETGSAATAERSLEKALDAHRTPIAWISFSTTPDADLPRELAAAAPHVVRVRGRAEDGQSYEIEDRGIRYNLTHGELATSRGLVRSEKQRLLLVDPPSQSLDLGNAVQAALRACAAELLDPPPHLPAMAGPNSGIVAFEKLARLLADPRDPKGWLKQFPRGLALYEGLTGLYRHVEIHGSGGAHRPIYASFLLEAAEVLGQPRLAEVAAHYRTLGEQWADFAEAALPDTVPLLASARAFLTRRRTLFRDQGSLAAEGIRDIDENLAALRAAAAESFPIEADAVRNLLADLGDRMAAIAAQERAAVEALQAATA